MPELATRHRSKTMQAANEEDAAPRLASQTAGSGDFTGLVAIHPNHLAYSGNVLSAKQVAESRDQQPKPGAGTSVIYAKMLGSG
jgi:hypothetical protein